MSVTFNIRSSPTLLHLCPALCSPHLSVPLYQFQMISSSGRSELTQANVDSFYNLSKLFKFDKEGSLLMKDESSNLSESMFKSIFGLIL